MPMKLKNKVSHLTDCFYKFPIHFNDSHPEGTDCGTGLEVKKVISNWE